MKYICITLHDSDFWNELYALGYYLSDIINNTVYSSCKINEAMKQNIIDFITSSHCLLATMQGRCEDKEAVSDYIARHLRISIISDNEINSNIDNLDTLYVAMGYCYDPKYSYFVV